MSTRDIEIAAVAHTAHAFDSTGWTVVPLSSIGPNMTEYQPGQDIASMMVENRFESDGSAFVILRDPPAADSPASMGFEVEPGGVLTLDKLRGVDRIAVRGNDAGIIKVLIRSYKTAVEAPW